MAQQKIHAALLSVFHKEGLAPIVQKLHSLGVTLYSTGGTAEFIRQMDIPVVEVESLTGYPSILGGRVKTLHPKIFGGILARSSHDDDRQQLDQYQIPGIDLVIVDLYPFAQTVATTEDEAAIIEKIDIGGIALIRAAAKNYDSTLIISHRGQYESLLQLLENQRGSTTLAERKHYAARAFGITAHYDSAIFNYFNQSQHIPALQISETEGIALRYGENPHQEGRFFGPLEALIEQLHGKSLSYNNLVDIDAALHLIAEFEEPTVAVLKHTNPCGVATRPQLAAAWEAALAGDPVSAFGGIVVANRTIDEATAAQMHPIFLEVVIAPGYSPEALEILKGKKNRILLKRLPGQLPAKQFKQLLNGVLEQDKDNATVQAGAWKCVTREKPSAAQAQDMVFAMKVCKHLKSNAIALAKDQQLIGMGAGQTSRIDALKQAIQKAHGFSFDTRGAVLASDAFFPFKDSVEVAGEAGIVAVIQPGGSKRDQESVDQCDASGMAMVMTGIRHFRH